MAVEKLNYDTKEEWLEARKGYVTATEVAKLARGSSKVWDELRDQKAGLIDAPDISHLPAVIHGNEREIDIAEWVASLDGAEKLQHNRALYARDGKYAATPDMVTTDLTVVGEIKTISEKRLASLTQWPTPAYYDQIQWQLFVTGAEMCIFAWEPYLSENGEITPWVPDRGNKLVMRDEKRISELKDIADRFLSGENSQDIPDNVQVLFSELRDILKREEEIKPLLDRKAEIENELREFANGEHAAWDSGDLRVSISPPGVSKRFDKKKLFADNPDINESDYVTESKTKARVRVTFNG